MRESSIKACGSGDGLTHLLSKLSDVLRKAMIDNLCHMFCERCNIEV
jgi:hypothetical protein